jgi:hypothetical protein
MNRSFYRIVLMILNISHIVTAYMAPTMCMSPTPLNNNNKLVLRGGVSHRSDKSDVTINCNKKYLYINYLLTLRNVKKTIKNSANSDVLYNINNMIESIINVSSSVNPQNHQNPLDTRESMLFIGNASIPSVIINDDLIAKKLLLANVQIDVSNIKYIQISTKNDTLIVELDKNNNIRNDNVVKYDLKTMDALISAVSILMNLLNVH